MPEVVVRPFMDGDYLRVKELYEQSETFGGQFDEDRDSLRRIGLQTDRFSEAVLVALIDNRIVGTVSLIEDGRTAWIFRFAVDVGDDEHAVASELHKCVALTARQMGHSQLLVYSPADNERLKDRYRSLGLKQGADYTCFFEDISDV